ncbi:hypothetical protein SOASR030_15340 [Leminorella grimontii]|uniref:DUF5862 domain-containing protein n=1 Tax=Leminorella grimontii TaxID=82981 RepID=A0AAV5N420_9GAMM|nr:hypothetical protein [Leminorella grimontii]KFC97921.1 hypothetical protein GLGR_0158 [Leminorella grimontii ATCC 33999 = DSM 5078]GKX55422.1 hypothetical protein SOASR030_15340 [Leminorella grimontii]GKX61033.1 hypothetical protein SOASR031_33480 [Leminorella grimontii]VFS56262.1 Uncharacterised protein [Leminorella grimontii]
MRELSSAEIEQVNGAGFVQDAFASVGEVAGSVFGGVGLSVVQGIANKFSPALGEGIKLLSSAGSASGSTVGRLAGYALGGFVEGTFSGLFSGFKNQFTFWK